MRHDEHRRQGQSRDWNRRNEYNRDDSNRDQGLTPDRPFSREEEEDRSFGYGPAFGGGERNMGYRGTFHARPDQHDLIGPKLQREPRSYKYPGYHADRPDHEIEHEIYDRIDNHGDIPGHVDIQVQVSEHVVTLTGDVRSPAAKIAAWDCAWMTPGVEDVFNNLVVKRRGRSGGG